MRKRRGNGASFDAGEGALVSYPADSQANAGLRSKQDGDCFFRLKAEAQLPSNFGPSL